MMEICGTCGKEFGKPKQLLMHRVSKHGYKKPAEPQPELPKGEQSEQPQQADLLEKLKALGIQPEQMMAVLSPLVEASVIKTLEKMQLGEAINKKVSEVETKLSGQIKQTLEPLQQSQSSGDNQPQNTQLRDTILTGLAQKFLNPGSEGAGGLTKQLEQLTGLLEFTHKIADTFYSPIQEAELRAQKRLIGQLDLYRKAGASPDKATEMTIKQNE